MRDRVLATRGPFVIYEGRSMFLMGSAGEHEHKCMIKVLTHRGSEDEDTVLRFAREAVLGYELTHVHPNLVTTRDFGMLPDGRLFVVTDYEPITMDQLREVLRGDLPAIRVIAHAVLSALVYLHHQGLAHRGIIAANIHLSWDGAILLGDLSGVAMSRRYIADDVGGPDAPFDAVCRQDLRELGHLLQELITGFVTLDSKAACQSLPDILPLDLRALVTRLLRPENDPPDDPFTADKAFLQLRRSRELFAPRDHFVALMDDQREWLQRKVEQARAVQVDDDEDEGSDDDFSDGERAKVTAAIRAVLKRLEQSGAGVELDSRDEDDDDDDAGAEMSETDASETDATVAAVPVVTVEPNPSIAPLDPLELADRRRRRPSESHEPRSRSPQSPLALLLAALLGILGASAAFLLLADRAVDRAADPDRSVVSSVVARPDVAARSSSGAEPLASTAAHRSSREPGKDDSSELAGAGEQQNHRGSEAGASASCSDEGPTRGGATVQQEQYGSTGQESDLVLLVDEPREARGESRDVQLWIANPGASKYNANNLILLDANHRPASADVTAFEVTAVVPKPASAREIAPGEVARITMRVRSTEVLSGESFTILVSEAGGKRPAAITSRRALP